jgi:DNA transposition AAA+ family ATPase
MMNTTPHVNRPAPLKNVAAFAQLIEEMVSRDPDLPGLACFHGPSGWGKTKSAVYGATRSKAAYIECDQFTTARSLLISLLMELGVPVPRGSVPDMISEAIMRMAAQPRRPVIVDEAHFVARRQFVDALRSISDKSGAPVILIGEEMLPKHLEMHERVHNRVLRWLPAQPCDAEDFALLVKNRCPEVAVAPDLAESILRLTKGNTRRIVVNLSRVRETAATLGTNTMDLATFGGAQAIYVHATPSMRRDN